MDKNHGFWIKHPYLREIVQIMYFKPQRICWDGKLVEEHDVEMEVKKPLENIFEIEDEKKRDLILWHPITRFD